jgi:hypothetical protein
MLGTPCSLGVTHCKHIWEYFWKFEKMANVSKRKTYAFCGQKNSYVTLFPNTLEFFHRSLRLPNKSYEFHISFMCILYTWLDKRNTQCTPSNQNNMYFIIKYKNNYCNSCKEGKHANFWMNFMPKSNETYFALTKMGWMVKVSKI